ncbi:MAG: GtrA family protein [Eubacteriales bacterium]|nr:GtrA family protein [Eubacteriales bacterium]
MNISESQKHNFWEFIRYCVVGGTAFLFETGTHWTMWKFILGGETDFNTFIATAAGFIIGLAVNYILSIIWVFTTDTQQKQGKTLRAFLIFTVVGIIGFGLKEILMFLGAVITDVPLATFGEKTIPYYTTHVVSAGIVLIWNYIGRKIFVFKKEKI